jgi:outer membrane protein
VLAAWTALALCCALPAAAFAEALPEALVKAYQTNPQLNAERARQRATDENVPQALAGYRPQIVASLSAGLQAVRNLLPDNTIQTATLKHWNPLQRFPNRQQRAGRGTPGAVRPRGAAQCRPGRAA